MFASWACWPGSAAVLYGMFAMLQLTLMLFFAPLFTAATVSYEKDRRTFNLLLMTSLSDLEIVLGKLVAGLLNILIILGASVGLAVALCAAGWDLVWPGRQPVRGDRRLGSGRGRDGPVDRPLARPDLPVDLADDPDGRLLGRGGRAVLGRLSDRWSSWACRSRRSSIRTARCSRCSIPGRIRSPAWSGPRAWSTSVSG